MKKVLFMLLVFQLACYASYDLVIKMDKFNPNVKTLVGDSMEITSFFSLKDFVSGNVINVVPKYVFGKEISSFNLTITRMGTGWIFINQVTFLIDNTPYTIKTNTAPFRDVWSGSTVLERVTFEIPKELFSQIIKSKSIPIRLSGQQYYVEQEFNEDTINNLSLFYNTALLYEKCRIDSSSCTNKDNSGIPFGNKE